MAQPFFNPIARETGELLLVVGVLVRAGACLAGSGPVGLGEIHQ